MIRAVSVENGINVVSCVVGTPSDSGRVRAPSESGGVGTMREGVSGMTAGAPSGNVDIDGGFGRKSSIDEIGEGCNVE